MVLLLAGFDLTCEISPDGKTCRVVPIEYPLPAFRERSSTRLANAVPAGNTAAQKQQFTCGWRTNLSAACSNSSRSN